MTLNSASTHTHTHTHTHTDVNTAILHTSTSKYITHSLKYPKLLPK